MTPPASTEPMHCDHECDGNLCYKYRESVALGSLKNLKPCPAGTDGYTSCKYDTRARGPGAEQAPALSHIHPDRHGCLTCLNPDCPIWQAADQNCWKSLAEHDAALIAQEREKLEMERAQLTTSALNKQDLLSRLISIDQNAPDIRTVEQELQRMIEDIKSGAFDECNPEQCRHVIKMMKAGVSVCEKEIAQARERVLNEVEAELLDFCKGDSAKAIKQVIESLRHAGSGAGGRGEQQGRQEDGKR